MSEGVGVAPRGGVQAIVEARKPPATTTTTRLMSEATVEILEIAY